MISDRLIITKKARNNATKIFNVLKEESIILIYGGSGTQKSETADCLQELLFHSKKQSIVVSLDDFYLTHPTIRNKHRKTLGIESVGLSEIDWEKLRRICDDFKNRKSISIQRVHKYADVVEHVTLSTGNVSTLVIEGLFAGYLKKENYGDFSVYLEGNPTQTLKFRELRGKENEQDDFRKAVVQKEYNVVSQLKRYADLVLPFIDLTNE